MAETCTWGNYTFKTYSRKTEFNEISAVYIYVCEINGEFWAAYIGESGNLGTRIKEHTSEGDMPDDTIPYSRQFIHCLSVPNGERQRIERALIGAYNPPLNKEHRTAPAASEISIYVRDLKYR